MIDHLRQIAIFTKAVDHGSFRGAAVALNLSPSVVSHHISQLEEYLGVALLYRTTRKITLTAEGERLLLATRDMLHSVEAELMELSAEAHNPSGTLRITASTIFAHSHLMQRISEFAVKYPRIRLELDFSDHKKDLVADGVDIAIRTSLVSKASNTSRKLLSLRRIIVASPQFLAQNPISSPHDFTSLPWVSLTPTKHMPLRFIKDGERAVEIKPKNVISANYAQAVYFLARTGMGLAVVPELMAKEDIELKRMSVALPSWTLPPMYAHALWPANAPKHGLVHLALKFLDDR